jgi:hypothetical protein
MSVHSANVYYFNSNPCHNLSDGRKRTPKWIKKAGLVDDSEDKRRAAKSQWAKRYDERLPNSTLDEADLAEGEEGGNYVPSRTIDEEEVARRRREGLWSNEDEEYYNEGERPGRLKQGISVVKITAADQCLLGAMTEREHDRAPNQQHWHYPANFEGAEAVSHAPILPYLLSASFLIVYISSPRRPQANHSVFQDFPGPRRRPRSLTRTLILPTRMPTDLGTPSSTTTCPSGVESTDREEVPVQLQVGVGQARSRLTATEAGMGTRMAWEVAGIRGIRLGLGEAGRRGMRIGIISSKPKSRWGMASIWLNTSWLGKIRVAVK